MQIDTEVGVRQGGRHFIGLGHQFIRYPAHRIVLAFCNWPELSELVSEAPVAEAPWVKEYGTIRGRTEDGMKVDLSVAVTISLGYDPQGTAIERQGDLKSPPPMSKAQSDSLISLWKRHGHDADTGFAALWNAVDIIMKSISRDVSSRYVASNFYQKRSEVSKALLTRMQRELVAYDITVHTVDVIGIGLPERYYGEIQATEIAKQEREAAEHERVTKLTEAQTALLRRQTELEGYFIQTQFEAEGVVRVKTQESGGIEEEIRELSKMWANVSELMDFSAPRDLLDFAYLISMSESEMNQLTFQLPVPTKLRNRNAQYENEVEAKEWSPFVPQMCTDGFQENSGTDPNKWSCPAGQIVESSRECTGRQCTTEEVVHCCSASVVSCADYFQVFGGELDGKMQCPESYLVSAETCQGPCVAADQGKCCVAIDPSVVATATTTTVAPAGDDSTSTTTTAAAGGEL